MWRGMNVSFRDMLFLLVFAYLVVGAVALAHVRKQQEEISGITPPGAIIVDLQWDNSVDADVDLWVEAPGDVPVGYSNKGGAVFNLLRDDLGLVLDLSGRNFETAYSRGIVPGEYTVNAHLFRNRSPAAVIPVNAIVSVREGKDGAMRQVLASHAELVRENQEITVFRFRLDEHGHLADGSVTSLFKPLRSGSKS